MRFHPIALLLGAVLILTISHVGRAQEGDGDEPEVPDDSFAGFEPDKHTPPVRRTKVTRDRFPRFHRWMKVVNEFFTEGNWLAGGPDDLMAYISRTVQRLLNILVNGNDDQPPLVITASNGSDDPLDINTLIRQANSGRNGGRGGGASGTRNTDQVPKVSPDANMIPNVPELPSAETPQGQSPNVVRSERQQRQQQGQQRKDFNMNDIMQLMQVAQQLKQMEAQAARVQAQQARARA